jgi:hypothetical protein
LHAEHFSRSIGMSQKPGKMLGALALGMHPPLRAVKTVLLLPRELQS